MESRHERATGAFSPCSNDAIAVAAPPRRAAPAARATAGSSSSAADTEAVLLCTVGKIGTPGRILSRRAGGLPKTRRSPFKINLFSLFHFRAARLGERGSMKLEWGMDAQNDAVGRATHPGPHIGKNATSDNDVCLWDNLSDSLSIRYARSGNLRNRNKQARSCGAEYNSQSLLEIGNVGRFDLRHRDRAKNETKRKETIAARRDVNLSLAGVGRRLLSCHSSPSPPWPVGHA